MPLSTYAIIAYMVQSAELLLDDELDAAVRREWTALSEAGLPSQNRHTGESNRPHISIAVARTMPIAVDDGDGVRFDSFDVRLGGLVVFGGGAMTLARLVVPSVALLDLHRRLFDVVGTASMEHLTPGRWTPHVTLARRLTPDETSAAIRILAPGLADLEGSAVALRRWDGEAKREWRIG